MRFACTALVFSLLLFQKDPNGELPLQYRPRSCGLCWEQGLLRRLGNTFCWDPGLCWVAESPWGSYLAGMAMVLLWALLESWAASCLTSLPPQLPPSTVHLESETARETEFRIPRRKCSLCVWGQPSTSTFQSDDQSSEMHRHSCVTFEDLRRRPWEEVLYSEYPGSRSSSSSRTRSLPDLSSSSSCSSFSSSCFGLPCLKSLASLCTSGYPDPAKRSLETITALTCATGSPYDGSESESSGSCTVPHDPKLPDEEGLCLQVKGKPAQAKGKPAQAKGKPASRGALFLLEKCSETESVSLFLQPKEVQTQTSFAGINIIQRSAYEKKDHIILVEKSLQVQMGPVRLPKARPSLPTPIFTDVVGKRGKPAALPVLALTSLQHTDRTRKHNHIASLCGLLGTFEKTTPVRSSQRGECSGLNAVFAMASSLDDFEPAPLVVEKDTIDFLEFHIKKKMVQWKCGMPSVVAKSVDAFQSLPSLRQDKYSQMPRETFTLILTDGVDPALPSSPRTAVGTNSSKGARGPKESSIRSSWEWEDIQQLAFHAAVKRLEIKMGAFPEMVENSFQLFCDLSENPLPKMISSGNKILMSKHPLLPLLPQENVCILDLNIKRKCLAFTGSFATIYTKLAAALTSTYSQFRESEKVPTERVAQLLVSIWRQVHTVEISYLGLVPPRPAPQPLGPSASSASPPFSTEESTEVQFQDGPPKKPVAHQVPADPPRTMVEQLLVKRHWRCHQEKMPEQRLNQWSLPSSFDLPERGPSQQAPPPSFDLPEQGPNQWALPSSLDLPEQRLNQWALPSSFDLPERGSSQQAPPPSFNLPERGPCQQAFPPSFDQPNPKGSTSRKAMKFQAEASIVRTSILLELELKKEKLNVHLKKKMQASLRPPQGAGLELTIKPGRKAKTSGAPRQACPSAQPLGRPHRSFCYVCVPSDETGTQLKTACWSLPKWILEMNGYRTPKVARFASKSKSSQLAQK